MQGGNLDRVSAYNICGANQDDVAEPSMRRPRDYDDVRYEDDEESASTQGRGSNDSMRRSRGDRGSFDSLPKRPKRRGENRRGQGREWPAEDHLAPVHRPPVPPIRQISEEKSPGPSKTPGSKGLSGWFTPKKPKESFRTKTLTELTANGTGSVARVKEGNVKFPTSWSGHKVSVFNPYHPKRLMWDATMLVLIVIIAVVTPFELTFLSGLQFGKGFEGRGAWGLLVIFYLNRISDVFFLSDMVLTFNTSFFDGLRGRWVEERSHIAREYLRCWFWLDVLSLLPYSIMFGGIKAAGLIRVIRLVRLLKLLKLAKQPRIMAKLRQFITMPIKQQTLIKYFFIIFFIIHWTACTLRLLTSFAVGECRPKGSDKHSGLPFDDECARTYLNTHRRWGQGPWSQYASAIIWSIGAMSGEAYLPANMEETVLNTLVMLMGIVVMAFLVGELSNILGNFDPVGNEFEQTVDNLSSYLESNQYPEMLRLKLREYVLLSEPIYREKYYIELMKQFSPSLRITVANFQLSHYVANIPFFAFSIQRGCGFEEGAIMDVQVIPEPTNDPDDVPELEWRRATIVAADPMTEGYEVAYHDGHSTNESKVSVNRLKPVDQRLHHRMVHINRIRRKFVGDFALNLEPMLFMPGDSIIEANWSRCDSLYLVTTGTCVVIKERLNSMFDIRLRHYGSTIGGDISTLLIAGEKRRLRHYDCKAHNAVQIYKMSDDDFLELMRNENYADFARTIKYFGFCMLLKMLTFRQMERATASGLTLKEQFATLEAANPFRPEELTPKASKPARIKLASDLVGLLDQLRLSKSVRAKVVAELKKHEIYSLETAQALRPDDWRQLDLKLGTRSLILSKLEGLQGYLSQLTDPSQGCARP